MAQAPLVVLTTAGFDPSSGAGVTADIKTTAAHGCYGVACITALTVQSTAGGRGVEAGGAETRARAPKGTFPELHNAFGSGGNAGMGEKPRGGAGLFGGGKEGKT